MGTVGILYKVEDSINYIRSLTSSKPRIAIVLGTGMHSIIESVSNKVEIEYSNIPHFPVSTVRSHKSKLIFGDIKGVSIVLVAGRFHYYEGYNMEEVTYYVHVLKSLGVDTSILTSASGGLNENFKEGELVLIDDHINMFPENPLRGQNDEKLGPRFPDMLNAYPQYLKEVAMSKSASLNIALKRGIYLGWQGPTLETPAEYHMAHNLGADLVGMSTIPEVIVNKYRSINTLALTIVSNICYPPSAIKETTIDEVINVVNKNALKLQKLILAIITKLDTTTH
jgi:purine-nucleoside phosphorylase